VTIIGSGGFPPVEAGAAAGATGFTPVEACVELDVGRDVDAAEEMARGGPVGVCGPCPGAAAGRGAAAVFRGGARTDSVGRGEALTFGSSLGVADLGLEGSGCGVGDGCAGLGAAGAAFGTAAAGVGVDVADGVGGGGIDPLGGPYWSIGRVVGGRVGGAGLLSLIANIVASKA
jgi:hypothetical protein